jgi:hypothetical protein
MKILVCSTAETQHWKYFLNHFDIDYQLIDLYDADQQRFYLPITESDTILITDYIILDQLYRYSKTDIIEYTKHNKLLIVANADSPVLFYKDIDKWQQLDTLVSHNSLWFVLECSCFSHSLTNIQVDFDSESKFFDIIEQRLSLKINKQLTKDFLLMLAREDATRTYLWEQLQSRNLTSNAVAFYHKNAGGNPDFVFNGNTGHQFVWQKSLIPCIDFYSSCAFEIVAETITDRVCWFTEKTIRPIAGKTPFVTLAAPGALNELRKLGFKTFGSYINESYDLELDVVKRTDMIVNVVADIVNNGAIEFAKATQNITEHNWNRLLELKGAYAYHKDLKFFDLLTKLNALY